MENEQKTTILNHFDEVRIRLTKALIVVAGCIIICFPLALYIFPILMNPVEGIDLYYTSPTGLIGSYMLVCFYGGLVLASPYLLYHLIMFVNPALTVKEKRYVYAFLPGMVLLFIGGIMFCYFILLPPALRFLYYTFPDFVGGHVLPWWTVSEYIHIVTRLLFWMGVVFEIPLVMFFLSKIRVISPQWVRRKWKYAVLGSFVLGAIITPTFDPVNQALVAAPIIVLYVLGYFLAKLARVSRSKTDS